MDALDFLLAFFVLRADINLFGLCHKNKIESTYRTSSPRPKARANSYYMPSQNHFISPATKGVKSRRSRDA